MKHKRLLFILVFAACIALATQAWAQQSAPTNAQAAPGNMSAAVSFQSPAGDNGSSITGYTVVSHPSGGIDSNAGSNSLIHVVTGLSNGTAYTFTVTATNSLNETSAPSSASNSVTPSNKVLAAYAGTWHVGAMITGADSPWGQRCVQTVNADGTFTSNCTDIYGNTSSGSCTGWLFPYGLTATCSPPLPLSNFLCYGNTAATTSTVTACTGTVNDGSGSAYMHVVVKQGASYPIKGFQGGGWGDFLSSGSSPYWMQTSQTSTSSGYVTGSWTTSSGASGTFAQQLALSSDGEVTCVSGDCDPSSISFVDAGGTVAVGTSGPDSTNGDASLYLLIKQGTSYSLADLAGEWAGSELRSDGTWSRAITQVHSDGSYTSSQVNSDGTISTDFGKLAISPDGVVSCASTQPAGSGCKADFVMDAGKTVMTGTRTHNSGTAYSITVLTKAGSFLWQNASSTGGGWEYLSPFGFFNPSSSPWIYHQTLGWLYPVGTSTDSIWFWDPQWDGTGGWWWTSSSLFPWIYSATEKQWLYFDAGDSSAGARWFFSSGGQASTH